MTNYYYLLEISSPVNATILKTTIGNQQHASVITIKKNRMTNSKSLIGTVVAALVFQILINIPQYTENTTKKLQIKQNILNYRKFESFSYQVLFTPKKIKAEYSHPKKNGSSR